MRRSVRVAKRAIDMIGAAIGLAVSAPLVPLIAVAIYLDSPGPILFRQRRAGSLKKISNENSIKQLQFEEFEMHKFRTMIPNAEAKPGAVIAGQDDLRITRVGKFLRKSRLDELPQFWDVLRGKMSIVGPRPERLELLRDLSYAIPLFEERMRISNPVSPGSRKSRSATRARFLKAARSASSRRPCRTPGASKQRGARSPTICGSSCSTISRTPRRSSASTRSCAPSSASSSRRRS
jgi:lipopolysaccharide/colanic/teichoic acid biosynthesis glycosyltransferase